MPDRRWTLYCHVNKVNGKMYFGITCQRPEQRWMNGAGYAEHLRFGRAIRKYGWENFEHVIIDNSLSEQEAKSLETQLIEAYNTTSEEFGYNITNGGDGVSGFRHTEEARRKMSLAKQGEKRVNWGKHLSEETRKKISAQNIGRANPHKGIPISESHKQHISEAKYRPVSAYDDDDNLVFTFPSARHAAEALGVNFRNISLCVHGNVNIAEVTTGNLHNYPNNNG